MARRKKKGRSRRGEGSVFERRGRWVACITVRRPDGKPGRVIGYAATRDLALLELENLRKQHGGTVAPKNASSMTLAEFSAEWLRQMPVAPATLNLRKLSLDKHILPFLGCRPVAAIKSFDVGVWLGNIKDRGGRTQQIAMSTLSSLFKRAIELKIVSTNPVVGIPRPKAKPKKIRPFTADEVSKILDAVRDDRLFAMYVMAMFGGLRQGELFGLQWDDINWEAKTVEVKRQVCEVGGELHVKDPKTENALRIVGLPQVCIDALQARRVLAIKEGQAAEPWLFLNGRGKLIRRSTFGCRHWKPLLKRLGLAHRGAHHTRHTVATLMLKNGAPLHVVSGVIGHSQPSTTADLYAHLQEGDHAIAAEAIAKAVRWQSDGKKDCQGGSDSKSA